MTSQEQPRGRTRRELLGALGTGSLIVIGGCSGNDSQEDTQQGLNDPEYREELGLDPEHEYTDAETAALKEIIQNRHWEQKFQLNASGRGSFRFPAQFKKFLNDDDIPQAFRDTQLKHWKELDRGEDYSISYQNDIVEKGMLYKDDWNANGLPQTLADGSEGPGSTRLDGNPDNDGFMTGYYDHDRTVFDVKASGTRPSEWEYLGFQPGQGDKVGKLGDNPENWKLIGFEHEGLDQITGTEGSSIASYLDSDVPPEDLLGNKIDVILWDRAKGAPEPDTEAMTREFEEASPNNEISEYSIDLYHITREPFKQEETWDAHQVINHWESSTPESMHGPVNYAFIGKVEGPGSLALDQSYGAQVGSEESFSDQFENPQWGIMHELYGHGHTDNVSGGPDAGAGNNHQNSVQEDGHQDWTMEGWKIIYEGLNIYNRPYFEEKLEIPLKADPRF